MGGEVTITVQVTPRAAGLLTNAASVATSSTDSHAANDSSHAAIPVYLPVKIDVQPGSSLNSVNTSKKGLVPEAILTTSEFDASALSVVTACFGDAEAPLERNCTDAQGGPRLANVDREAVEQSKLRGTHDFREGVRAAVERRTPVFTGR